MYNKYIAVMGGTFNPIHNGHINAAKVVLKELGPDVVLFIPSGVPPHKDISGGKNLKNDRYNMTGLALEGSGRFKISDIEINKTEKCYSVDTLKSLINMYNPKRLTLIIGSDMFLIFELWKNYDKIFQMCDLAVVQRFFDDTDALRKKKLEFSKEQQEKIKILDTRVVQISSTEIRNIIKNGQSVCKLVPPKVQDYIKANGLYLK